MTRAIQTALITLLVLSGVVLWRDLPRPPLPGIESLARTELSEIFGPHVRWEAFELDPTQHTVLTDVRVPALGGRTDTPGRREPLDGFRARRVRVVHDVAALARGRFVPLAIELEGAIVYTRETADGIAPEFPFTLPEGGADGPLPRVVLDQATLNFRARRNSTRLRPGSVLIAVIDRLVVEPTSGDRLRVEGTLATRGLGQDHEVIRIAGSADQELGSFALQAICDHVELTPSLLDLLPDDVAKPLRQDSIRSGSLEVRLAKAPGETPKLSVQWDADLNVQVRDLPGIEMIEAGTKEQLQELFGQGVLQLSLETERLNIESLVSEMAGGRVQASGWVDPENGAMNVEFSIQDLDLTDPAVMRALGDEGAAIFAQFAPAGIVDAVGRIRRTEDGTTTWHVDVVLEAASFEFIGEPGPSGRPEGFPYRIEQASGRLQIRPEGVFFEDIVGFHRSAEVTVRGYGRKGWGGEPTGSIKFGDDGAEIRLTVEVVNMALDEDVRRAVEGSEFAGLLDEFQLEGVIDRVEVDVTRLPGIDAAAITEVRLLLEGERFRYAPFPLLLEDVRGTITLERPRLDAPLEDGRLRGKHYAFAVTGWAEGAPLEVSADIEDHLGRGRLDVSADGIPLGGAVAEAIRTSPKTSESLGPVWDWLAPRGRADVEVSLPLSDDPEPLTLTAELRAASMRLAADKTETPLELTELSGTVAVRGELVELKRVRGKLEGAPVALQGEIEDGVEGRWDLQLRTEPVTFASRTLAGLDALAPLEDILPDGMRVLPGARMALALDLVRAKGEDQPLDVTVHATELEADLHVQDAGTVRVTGTRIYATRDVLRLQGLDVEGDPVSAIVDDVEFLLGQEDTQLAGRFALKLDGVRPRSAWFRFAPDGLQDFLAEHIGDRELSSEKLTIEASKSGRVRVEGRVGLVVPEGEPTGEGPRGTLSLEPLHVAIEDEGSLFAGRLRLEGLALDFGAELRDLRGVVEVERLRLGDASHAVGAIRGLSGKVEGLSFENLQAPIRWQSGVLRADPIRGQVSGGALAAEFSLQTGAPGAYEGRAVVRAFDVARLQQDLAPTGAPYRGRGDAQVVFQNRSGRLPDLTARGQATIRDGALGELPFVATVFALFAEVFSTDRRPEFERADVAFTFENEVFTFSQLDLAGPLFELPGRGTMDLGGVVDLTFTPDFIKSLALPGVMQLPVLGDIIGATLREEALYAVRVRGDLGTASPEVVALPGLGMDRGRTFEGMGPRDLPRRRVPRRFR